MANATIRTPETGETLPAISTRIAPKNALRKVQISLICPPCAFDVCPNAFQYATNKKPLAAQFLDTKQKCHRCGAHSQIGVSDPANYGGIDARLEL